jgi:hypothetical protein
MPVEMPVEMPVKYFALLAIACALTACEYKRETIVQPTPAATAVVTPVPAGTTVYTR